MVEGTLTLENQEMPTITDVRFVSKGCSHSLKVSPIGVEKQSSHPWNRVIKVSLTPRVTTPSHVIHGSQTEPLFCMRAQGQKMLTCLPRDHR